MFWIKVTEEVLMNAHYLTAIYKEDIGRDYTKRYTIEATNAQGKTHLLYRSANELERDEVFDFICKKISLISPDEPENPF